MRGLHILWLLMREIKREKVKVKKCMRMRNLVPLPGLLMIPSRRHLIRF